MDLSDYDNILMNYIGSGGSWQAKQLVLICLTKFVKNTPLLLNIFTAYQPPWRCSVPLCDGSDSLYSEPWTEFSIPSRSNSISDTLGIPVTSGLFKAAETLDSCKMFLPIDDNTNGTCQVSSFSSNITTCQSYVYDTSIMAESIATKFNMVCDNSYQRNLLDFAVMLGYALSCILGMLVVDRFGRRNNAILSCAMMTIFVLAGAVVQDSKIYIALRFAYASFMSISTITTNSLLVEMYKGSHRGYAYGIGTFVETTSMTILGALAYLERDWRYLHLWIGLIGVLVTPLLWLYLHESARYLIVNHREEEAEMLIEKIAKGNGRYLSLSDKEDIKTIIHNISKRSEATTKDNNRSVLTIFNKTYLAITISLIGASTASNWAYYGLGFNTASLSGDIYLNYVITHLLDLPLNLYMFLFLEIVGRRWTIIVFLCISGCSLTALAFIPKDLPYLVMTLYQVGRFGGGLSMYVLLMYRLELYPTTLRATAAFAISAASYSLGSLATLVTLLDQIWTFLPMLVLATPAFVFSLAMLVMPETRGKSLNENAQDAEKTTKN